jgi:MoaA/NifB/PqqE/SkfB family radical SAM enzyme
MCARETDTTFNKSSKHHLRVENIQQHFSDRVIARLDKMFMCGNYGDPAAGYYTMDIYNYFRKVNPEITLGMNTNGGLQNTVWWHELGCIMNQPQDYVVFSIDGNEDTNSVYRVNVNWTRLKENIKAFVSAGGKAHWDMLIYEHNQHQVDECEQLAREMGFNWFSSIL